MAHFQIDLPEAVPTPSSSLTSSQVPIRFSSNTTRAGAKSIRNLRFSRDLSDGLGAVSWRSMITRLAARSTGKDRTAGEGELRGGASGARNCGQISPKPPYFVQGPSSVLAYCPLSVGNTPRPG